MKYNKPFTININMNEENDNLDRNDCLDRFDYLLLKTSFLIWCLLFTLMVLLIITAHYHVF